MPDDEKIMSEEELWDEVMSDLFPNADPDEIEEELWDEVMSDLFPNADPDEIEEELDNWLKD